MNKKKAQKLAKIAKGDVEEVLAASTDDDRSEFGHDAEQMSGVDIFAGERDIDIGTT